MHPLCYEVIPYHLQVDRTIYFDEPIRELKLFTKTDDFYIDFLFKYANSGERFIYYSDFTSEEKNCADVFYQIHLLNIDHDYVIFDREMIKIWETCYNKSFNWYEYYLSDLKNDRFGRLKVIE